MLTYTVHISSWLASLSHALLPQHTFSVNSHPTTKRDNETVAQLIRLLIDCRLFSVLYCFVCRNQSK